uniref:Transcription factor domain-containing protein n=1 Tax=Coccidioides posadasii RMSCC 3488 TaxID=454284 RepID=A0A0J6EYK1_COCPO|nr:hypothetical protein CPAG_01982 [Coccidioides posadasii RMSCC 3488]
MATQEKRCGFPFNWKISASLSELIAHLPPRKYCDLLKNTYFQVFSPLFHVLHDPSFETELALLFVVLSIAVNGLDENDLLLLDIGREATAAANTRVVQRCWVLIGVSHHVAIAIGCHLDPDHFRLGTVEAEKRRRCWAALVILYMRKNVVREP